MSNEMNYFYSKKTPLPEESQEQKPAPQRSAAQPARQATQADEGWRARQARPEQPAPQPAAPARKATQADEGWRTKQAVPVRRATQADEGWRAQQAQAAAGRKATQADEGWRAQQAQTAAGRKATQADEGWRAQQAQTTAGRKATQADEGWRTSQGGAGRMSVDEVVGDETVNVFATIEAFQDAVAGVKVLLSSNGNRYPVKEVLSREGGESMVLLCASPSGKDVVAKVYYNNVNGPGSSFAARRKVLEYMQTPAGQKYTLAVQEVGQVEFGEGKYYFEIMPYCEQGDMTHEGPKSFEEIAELAAYLNEAFHSMHQYGLLHRDIKPANLYRLDGRVVVGDFGVAKLAKAGVTTHTVGTDGYRAPESVLAVSAEESAFYFDEKCDYYSLGVTLGSLYEGKYIYEGMNAAMMTAAIRNGRLPLTRMDPNREQLENLLSGLCRYDSRYRFGYEDVCRWVENHNYIGGIMEEEWPHPYRLKDGKVCGDEKSLFLAITENQQRWEEGKNHLYGKYFESFFKSFRTDIASAAQAAEEDWRSQDRDKGLAVFLKSLYGPGPIVWKGYTFRSLQELAEKMTATANPTAYADFLKQRVVSHWLKNTEGVSAGTETIRLVERIEAYSDKEPEIACYWFGQSFAGQKRLSICGTSVTNVAELIKALFHSPQRFYTQNGMEKLLDRKVGADLYGFLYSLGYQELVDKEWRSLNNTDTFDKLCVLIFMFEYIAQRAELDTGIVRKFFVEYGPIGVATYTKKLVDRKDIYEGLNTDGKQILSRIESFQPTRIRTLDEAQSAYNPLLQDVERLRKMLVNNPFCIQTGAYENKGVICKNLAGCFAFEIFGRMAPLGFSAELGYGKGDK